MIDEIYTKTGVSAIGDSRLVPAINALRRRQLVCFTIFFCYNSLVHPLPFFLLKHSKKWFPNPSWSTWPFPFLFMHPYFWSDFGNAMHWAFTMQYLLLGGHEKGKIGVTFDLGLEFRLDHSMGSEPAHLSSLA